MKKTVHKIVVHLLLSTAFMATGAENQQLTKSMDPKSAEFFQVLQEREIVSTGLSQLHSLGEEPESAPTPEPTYGHRHTFPWQHKEKTPSTPTSPIPPRQENKSKRLSQRAEHVAVRTAEILDPALAQIAKNKELIAAGLSLVVEPGQASELAGEIASGATELSKLGAEAIKLDQEKTRLTQPIRTLTTDVENAKDALNQLQQKQKKDKHKSAPHPEVKISSDGPTKTGTPTTGRLRKHSESRYPQNASLQPITEETTSTKTPPTQSPLLRRTKAASLSKSTDNPLITKIENKIHKTEIAVETTISGHGDTHKTSITKDESTSTVSTKPAKKHLTEEIKKEIETLAHHDTDPKEKVNTSKPPVPEVRNPDDDSFIKRHPWLVKGVFTTGIIASIIVALYKFNQLPPNIAKMIDEKLAFITTQLTTLTSRQWFNS